MDPTPCNRRKLKPALRWETVFCPENTHSLAPNIDVNKYSILIPHFNNTPFVYVHALFYGCHLHNRQHRSQAGRGLCIVNQCSPEENMVRNKSRIGRVILREQYTAISRLRSAAWLGLVPPQPPTQCLHLLQSSRDTYPPILVCTSHVRAVPTHKQFIANYRALIVILF